MTSIDVQYIFHSNCKPFMLLFIYISKFEQVSMLLNTEMLWMFSPTWFQQQQNCWLTCLDQWGYGNMICKYESDNLYEVSKSKEKWTKQKTKTIYDLCHQKIYTFLYGSNQSSQSHSKKRIHRFAIWKKCMEFKKGNQ